MRIRSQQFERTNGWRKGINETNDSRNKSATGLDTFDSPCHRKTSLEGQGLKRREGTTTCPALLLNGFPHVPLCRDPTVKVAFKEDVPTVAQCNRTNMLEIDNRNQFLAAKLVVELAQDPRRRTSMPRQPP